MLIVLAVIDDVTSAYGEATSAGMCLSPTSAWSTNLIDLQLSLHGTVSPLLVSTTSLITPVGIVSDACGFQSMRARLPARLRRSTIPRPLNLARLPPRFTRPLPVRILNLCPLTRSLMGRCVAISGAPVVEVTSVGGAAITLATSGAHSGTSTARVMTTTFAGHTFLVPSVRLVLCKFGTKRDANRFLVQRNPQCCRQHSEPDAVQADDLKCCDCPWQSLRWRVRCAVKKVVRRWDDVYDLHDYIGHISRLMFWPLINTRNLSFIFLKGRADSRRFCVGVT